MARRRRKRTLALGNPSARSSRADEKEMFPGRWKWFVWGAGIGGTIAALRVIFSANYAPQSPTGS